MKLRVFIVFAALLAPALAAAATDQEKFEKVLKKTTLASVGVVANFQKAKVACVCNDASPLADRAGILRREFIGVQWFVSCAVPSFDGTGSLSVLEACQGNWELLTR